jgi:hypothetical protein
MDWKSERCPHRQHAKRYAKFILVIGGTMITRNTVSDGNIDTILNNSLNNLPNQYLFSTEHRLRHPAAIYNISFGKVIDRLNNVMTLYGISKNSNRHDELIEEYIEFLSAINGYIDDMYNIFKCFYSISEVNNSKPMFAHEWLSNIPRDRALFTGFFSAFKDYRDYLTSIINKVKHEHAAFADVLINHPLGKVIGYVILRIDNTGALAPDEKVHPMHNNMSTGNSYTYDIPYHVYYVYKIAELADSVIKYILNNNHNYQLICNATESTRADKLSKIFDSVSKLGNVYFPNEFDKEIYHIAYSNQEINIHVSRNLKLYKYNKYQVRYIFSGDGFTRSYKLPFM